MSNTGRVADTNGQQTAHTPGSNHAPYDHENLGRHGPAAAIAGREGDAVAVWVVVLGVDVHFRLQSSCTGSSDFVRDSKRCRVEVKLLLHKRTGHRACVAEQGGVSIRHACMDGRGLREAMEAMGHTCA